MSGQRRDRSETLIDIGLPRRFRPLPVTTELKDILGLSLATAPLVPVTPWSDRRTGSTFGGLRWSDGTPALEMPPDAARRRHLRSDQRVRPWNELDEVPLPLTVTTGVRPGYVYSYKGAWIRISDNESLVEVAADGV